MDAPRSRPRRVVGWLVVINLALWTGAVAWAVTGDRERVSLKLDHGFAWCVWPTRVHLSDVDLRIETHGWQMGIAAASATVDLHLLRLLSRRFSADDIDVGGLNLTFRVKREDADPEELAHSGPLAGLDAPIRTGQRPPPPAPEKTWAIELPHMHADLDRLWIDGVRSDLRGDLTTGVFAVASTMVSIAPTRLRVHDGIVFVGDDMAATSLKGRIVLMVAPLAHREVRGADVLRQLTGLVELRADLTGARPFARWLAGRALRLGGGGGPVRIELALWSGVVTDGGLKYRTGSLVAHADAATVRARAALDVEIAGDPARARASLTLRDVGGRTRDGENEWWRAPTVVADATFVRLDLASDRPRLQSASAVVPAILLRDLGGLGDLGESATLEAGRGEASMRVAYDPEDGLAGHLGARLHDVAASSDTGVRVQGDARMTTDVRADPQLERVLLHPLALRVDHVEIESDRGRAKDFWARVGAGRVRWDREAERVVVEVVGEIDDLAPVLAQAKSSSSMTDVIQDLEDLEFREPLKVHAHAMITRGAIDVRLVRAERPTLELRGRWRRVGEDTRAAFLLGRLKVGLVKSGKDEWTPRLAVDEEWLRRHERWVGQL